MKRAGRLTDQPGVRTLVTARLAVKDLYGSDKSVASA
jgi:hypothetical protein